ncbi:putative transposable element [Pseudoloma neurophilia]|uniref:Putative transposable element n=1 Tax=Pseudoloma neurophilia TaxID=146866 RepID=A0A0R0LWE8_9MICR|nr:putative transposable element [Pseudoloma neurophilia]
MNSRYTTTSTYHPQSNGTTERFNKTFIKKLAKMFGGDLSKWSEMIEPARFAYNTTPISSLKASPFKILYGRDVYDFRMEEMVGKESCHNKTLDDIDRVRKELLNKRKRDKKGNCFIERRQTDR